MCCSKKITKEILLTSLASCHPHYVFESIRRAVSKFIKCASETSTHLHHQKTPPNVDARYTLPLTPNYPYHYSLHYPSAPPSSPLPPSLSSSSPPSLPNAIQENNNVIEEKNKITETCCFNQTTYDILKQQANHTTFQTNVDFYLKTLNSIIITYNHIERISFKYYTTQNFIVYNKLLEIIDCWDKSYILIRGWFNHYLFMIGGVPKNYPYQKIFKFNCKQLFSCCCEEATHLLNKENISITSKLPKPMTTKLLTTTLLMTKWDHTFNMSIDRIQHVILHTH